LIGFALNVYKNKKVDKIKSAKNEKNMTGIKNVKTFIYLRQTRDRQTDRWTDC